MAGGYYRFACAPTIRARGCIDSCSQKFYARGDLAVFSEAEGFLTRGQGWRRELRPFRHGGVAVGSVVVLLLGPLACASPPAPEDPAVGSAASPRLRAEQTAPEVGAPLDSATVQPVPVLFPAGACRSGRLEVQVWQRQGSGGRWRAHPEHPFVEPGTCRFEDPARLLNEIRVRCVDPAGRRSPSNWVIGADITPRDPTRRCPDARPHPNAIR